jgi:hypothetical protein
MSRKGGCQSPFAYEKGYRDRLLSIVVLTRVWSFEPSTAGKQQKKSPNKAPGSS